VEVDREIEEPGAGEELQRGGVRKRGRHAAWRRRVRAVAVGCPRSGALRTKN